MPYMAEGVRMAATAAAKVRVLTVGELVAAAKAAAAVALAAAERAKEAVAAGKAMAAAAKAMAVKGHVIY